MFQLIEAPKPYCIAEWQYGRDANLVLFSRFTSCIGVVGRITWKGEPWVIGVHLALKDKQGNHVKHGDMKQVINLLKGFGIESNTVKLIGQIGVWENAAEPALGALRQAYKTNPGVREYRYNDGTYGARLVGGEIQPCSPEWADWKDIE